MDGISDRVHVEHDPSKSARLQGRAAGAQRYTQVALDLKFVGPNIASTYYETIELNFPLVGFTGETPTVDSPDVLTSAMPFDVLWDGSTFPLIASYTSTDVTL